MLAVVRRTSDDTAKFDGNREGDADIYKERDRNVDQKELHWVGQRVDSEHEVDGIDLT